MCLSLKLVGNCVKVSAFLVLVLGIVGIVCSVYIGKDDIMVSDVEDTKKSIMAVVIVFSVLLILIGLSGIIGAFKQNSCCLFIYNIGIGIFFVAFLIISIVAFAVFKKYYNLDIKNTNVCESQSWLNPINNMAVKSEAYLCSSQCACNWNDTSFETTIFAGNTTTNTSTTNSSSNTNSTTNNNNTTTNNNTTNNDNKTTNDSKTDATNNTNNGSSTNHSETNTTTDNSTSNGTTNRTYNYSAIGSSRVQDCPNYENDFSFAERQYGSTLEILEKSFKCSGVCRDSSYYTFTNVNNGVPSDDCATTLVDIFVSYSKRIGAATVVMTVLLFLTLVASFCLCCHPDKRKEEGGFYQKMGSI